jgi:hypothetical protein
VDINEVDMTLTRFKIERNIPLGPVREKRQYPLDDMKIGESIAVPPVFLQGIRMAISQRKRRGGKERFTVRRDGENFRCWRIK